MYGARGRQANGRKRFHRDQPPSPPNRRNSSSPDEFKEPPPGHTKCIRCLVDAQVSGSAWIRGGLKDRQESPVRFLA